MRETPSERAAKSLVDRAEALKSVDLTLATTIKPLGENAKQPRAFNRIEDHYRATSEGQRFLEFLGTMDGKVVTRSVHFGDGGTFTDIEYSRQEPDRQSLISVGRHFWMEGESERRQLPQPLLYFHVGERPLQDALPDAESLGTARHLDRDCDLFLFRQVQWAVPQDQVYFLDRETATPIRVEFFRDDASRNSQRPMAVWSAKSLDREQGFSLTAHSSMTSFGDDGSPQFTWDFDVQSVKFNDVLPDDLFRPTFQPGVTVVDGIAHRTYKTPSPEEARPSSMPSRALTVALPSPRPVVATGPRGGTGGLATGALALGIALALVGLLGWWRRRGVR